MTGRPKEPFAGQEQKVTVAEGESPLPESSLSEQTQPPAPEPMESSAPISERIGEAMPEVLPETLPGEASVEPAPEPVEAPFEPTAIEAPPESRPETGRMGTETRPPLPVGVPAREEEPSSIPGAIKRVLLIIEDLKTATEDMEQLLEMLEDVERQQISDEREIKSLRKALDALHRGGSRTHGGGRHHQPQRS